MEKGDSRSYLSIKLDAMARLIHWHFLSKRQKSILVTEYPKSGGSWLTLMLSEYFDLVFPRNRNINLFRSYILHGHNLYSSGFNNPVALIRDGRDVMVSFYHHLLFRNDRNSHILNTEASQALQIEDPKDIKKNLPHVIDYLNRDYLKKPWTRRFSWSDFIDSYCNKHFVVRYEDLLMNPVKEMIRIVGYIDQTNPVNEDRISDIVKKYAFDSMKKSEENLPEGSSFLRKGIIGDWKNYFTKETAEVFNSHLGHALVKAGYVKDLNWYEDETG